MQANLGLQPDTHAEVYIDDLKGASAGDRRRREEEVVMGRQEETRPCQWVSNARVQLAVACLPFSRGAVSPNAVSCPRSLPKPVGNPDCVITPE